MSGTVVRPPEGFEIPARWQSSLSFKPTEDTRTDEELLASLSSPPTVQSEKNIWAFWHSGVQSMPNWCKRNIYSWIRINPGWTVRVLDQVPASANYALKYIPGDMLPKTFIEGTMEGEVTGQHASDFIRGASIYLYGGVYMDVGCILFRSLDNVCWHLLEQGQKTVGCPIMYGQIMANHFVAGRKEDLFIRHWQVFRVPPSVCTANLRRHELFMHCWKDRTSPRGLIASPSWQPLMESLVVQKTADTRYKWDFKVDPVDIFEYITQVMCWIRLCHIREPGPDGFDGATYWQQKVQVWDSLSEHWPVEEKLGFTNAQRFMDLMAVHRDDTSHADWHAAQELVFSLLSKSTMEKVTHGKNLTHSIALGVLLDSPENDGADIREGTFFELLRYGAVNFEQTRPRIGFVESPPPDVIVEKGIQEP